MEEQINTDVSVSHEQSPVCLNCGSPLSGHYCSECGQSSRVRRINPHYILVELLGGVLQLDHGFLFTARELMLRPGKSLHAFLAGQRRSFSRPFGFLLLASAIYVLVTYWQGSTPVLGEVLKNVSVSSAEEGAATGAQTVFIWLSGHYTYASLLLLPLFSLCTRLVFFRSGLRYSEHLVINMFIKGQLALLITLIYPLLIVSPLAFALAWFCLAIYPFYALGQIFNRWQWVFRVLGVAACFILYWLVILVILGLVGRVSS